MTRRKDRNAPVTLEVCVESVAGAAAAEKAGAGRIELCANLAAGGTTPSAGAIAAARARLGIGLHVMIRPRAGDFCYSAEEIEVMGRDIEAAKGLGADGVVLGVLTPGGEVDVEGAGRLLGAAQPLTVTFHRAFDAARDPMGTLEVLVRLGVDRVLTSGQAGSAAEGIEPIRRLVKQARGRIIVLPAGGITAANAARIVRETGAAEVHASCRTPGAWVTDPERVRALVAALADGDPPSAAPGT